MSDKHIEQDALFDMVPEPLIFPQGTMPDRCRDCRRPLKNMAYEGRFSAAGWWERCKSCVEARTDKP